MFKRLKTWIADKKLRLDNNLVDPTVSVEKKTIDMDYVQHAEKKFSELQVCSLAAHDAQCDIFNCTKNPCFIWEPDRIVSKEYKVKAKKSIRVKRNG